MSLESAGAPVRGRAAQRQRLAGLAITALSPGGVSRDRLIGLLWPDAAPERARHLLSHCIYLLRQALGEDALVVTSDAVRLNPDVVWCDVTAFEAAVRSGQHGDAAALYRGPFLDGFYLANNPEFERWVDGERARLARGYAGAAEALAAEREAAGDSLGAVQWWRRLAEQDPHNSRTVVRLVRALEASGDTAGALRTLRAHEAALRSELEIAPPVQLLEEIERLKQAHRAREEEAPSGRLPPLLPPAGARPATARAPRARRLVLVGSVALAALLVSVAVLGRDLLRGEAAARRPVLAVLPFESLSDDRTQGYFADGLTDVLITELARVPGLAVISRSSVARRPEEKPLSEIARELRAGYVVEGTVARDGPRMRINVQLIDGARDLHVWARRYERDVRDVLALQAEIAGAVAREIGVTLRLDSQDMFRRGPVASVPAYEAYLRGLYHSRSTGLAGGIEWFERAIALDSTLAPAHAGVARNLYYLVFFGAVEPKGGFARIRAAAERALALDSSLADAHGTLALVLMHWDRDWRGAERHFRRALTLDPNNADARHDYAHLLLSRGRERDAARETERATALDPVNAGLEACLGWHYLSGVDYEEAVAQSLRAVNAAPDFFWAHQTLGWGYERLGRYPEAIASLRRAVELSGGLAFTQASLAHALAASGDRAAATELLDRLTAERRTGRRYISPYDLAAVYAGLGDREQAFSLLNQAASEGAAQIIHLRWDPRLHALRDDPRFRALRRGLGL
ncbi:MAG TPA: tetratricopeptide repeat protein [Gemmatimonadales bacterium]|nr:tetratricopeptide repeat protein [Gemmatimonadales bacterium]